MSRVKAMLARYVLNVLIAIDQLLNALTGGDPDETLSSRAAKATHGTPFWRLGMILEAIDPGHLRRTVEHDEGKDALWR